MKNIITLTAVMLFSVGSLFSKENVGQKAARKSTVQVLAEGCAPATSSADLNINNVRARILGSGDMWWDLNDARYEVPKGSGKHSMFAGALWLGGYDDAGQLKMAAMTYRQTGVDYWPGPLDDATASITSTECQAYNKHWVIYREEVEIHAAWIACKEDPQCDVEERFPGYAPPLSIEEWPGNGIDQELPNKLAPYFESTENGIPGIYEPEHDYPGYDIYGTQDCQVKEVDLLYGDQTIWWVYNDKGNVHTETKAGALGFEIRAQAFAFTSNDEINNMTFNNYRIINKSTFKLSKTYFGTWFDPDLGNATDDIIGSDIARGLGYCYNADADDEGPFGYGLNPPAVGFDFFQGPFADYDDDVDNDRDGCIDGVRDSLGICRDENPATGLNERIIMSGFMYYNNDASNQGNPDVALDFYNYLNSKWKDGNNLIIESPAGKGNSGNGDGYVASDIGTATKFAYPGMSYDTTGAYPPFDPVDWWESPTNSADKRGLHSAGPFSLDPGALNFITTGVVWARNFASGDLFASVNDVIIADDKAQQLFDNCFNVLDGPDSPELEIVELDRQLIFKLKNAFNNKTIGYREVDPAITEPEEWTAAQIDSAFQAGYFEYRFEGFQIFQVSGPDVSVDNLYDPAQSRLIFQSDLKNDITQLVNFEVNEDLQNNALVPIDKTITANNDGIELTYNLKEDAFATGDQRLVNNREYYFYVIAYSQNQFEITDPNNLGINSQKTPYLAGRRIGNGQKAYLGIPHKVANTEDGTQTNSQYGDGLPITRFSGAGNSSNFLKITDESREEIVTNFKINDVDYESGFGPFDIKVVDPTEVKAGNFILTFENTQDMEHATWTITSADNPSEVLASSIYDISFLGEQLLTDMGLSISFRNAERPGYDNLNIRNNGFVGAEQIFSDPKNAWLTGVEDDDSYTPQNWILAGSANLESANAASAYNDAKILDASNNPIFMDPHGVYEGVLEGTWAPVQLTSDVKFGDFVGGGIRPSHSGAGIRLANLPNVDIVITSDPSKWSRCPVFELGEVAATNEGGVAKFFLRAGRTLNKTADGQLVPDPDPNNTGWSYFPGYAVNVETGRRLNIAFGENSWLKSENGGDMRWNPTANLTGKLDNMVLGGMHAVYILADSVNAGYPVNGLIDLSYKGDAIADYPLTSLINTIASGQISQTLLPVALGSLFSGMAWASIPLLSSPIYEFSDYTDIPNEVTISLRVAKPYQFTVGSKDVNNGYPQYGFNTEGRAVRHDIEIAKDALDLIRVVPNPYNGGSEYEDSQLDNIVKITNLPQTCKISIFMSNGTLIRTIDKDNTQTYVEWDLKNDFNVPIASGIYLIHVEAPGIGQKVVKWMGSLRPVDLNAF